MTPGKLRRRSVLGLLASVPLGAASPGRASAVEPPASAMRYTMAAFTNGSETDLYVYESGDATTYRLLRGPAYRPSAGLMRDPSIFRTVDGVYYLTYTASGDGRIIGFAHSTDRLTWTHLYNFTVPLPRVEATWAPEWFIDDRGHINVIVSLSCGHGFTPHLMTAADTSLRSWSALTPMVGLAPNPFDPSSLGYIDTTVAQHADRYFAFAKNENTKYIELAVAPHPLGPYLFIGVGDWAGWGAPREGQSIIRLPGDGWRIYFDAYTEGKYFYSDSYDSFRTWTVPRELPGLSGIVRHGTVFPESTPQHVE